VILSAFAQLPAESFKNERQIKIAGLFRIDGISQVEKAIDLIKRRGEGKEQYPYAGDL
jgi:hypothetical protein